MSDDSHYFFNKEPIRQPSTTDAGRYICEKLKRDGYGNCEITLGTREYGHPFKLGRYIIVNQLDVNRITDISLGYLTALTCHNFPLQLVEDSLVKLNDFYRDWRPSDLAHSHG